MEIVIVVFENVTKREIVIMKIIFTIATIMTIEFKIK